MIFAKHIMNRVPFLILIGFLITANIAWSQLEECVLSGDMLTSVPGQICQMNRFDRVLHLVCNEENTLEERIHCHHFSGQYCLVDLVFTKVINSVLDLPLEKGRGCSVPITYYIAIDGISSIPTDGIFLRGLEKSQLASLVIRNTKVNQSQLLYTIRSMAKFARVLILENNANLESIWESPGDSLDGPLERLELLNNPIKQIKTGAIIMDRWFNKLALRNMKLGEDGFMEGAIQIRNFNCRRNNVEIILTNSSLTTKNVGKDIITVEGRNECPNTTNNLIRIDLRGNKFDGIFPEKMLKLAIRSAAKLRPLMRLEILSDDIKCCSWNNLWLFAKRLNQTDYNSFINANCSENQLISVSTLDIGNKTELCGSESTTTAIATPTLETDFNSTTVVFDKPTTPKPAKSEGSGLPSYLLYAIICALVLIPILCLVWFMNCCSSKPSEDRSSRRTSHRSKPKPAKTSIIQSQMPLRGAYSLNKRQSPSGLSGLESPNSSKRTRDSSTVRTVPSSKISLASKKDQPKKSTIVGKSGSPGLPGLKSELPPTPKTSRSPISSSMLSRKSVRSALDSPKLAAKRSSPVERPKSSFSKSGKAKSSPK